MIDEDLPPETRGWFIRKEITGTVSLNAPSDWLVVRIALCAGAGLSLGVMAAIALIKLVAAATSWLAP